MQYTIDLANPNLERKVTPMNNELRELIKKLEYKTPDSEDAPLGLFDVNDLVNLISTQIQEAVIKELESVRVAVDWRDSDSVITMKSMITHQNVTNRISELKGKEDE